MSRSSIRLVVVFQRLQKEFSLLLLELLLGFFHAVDDDDSEVHLRFSFESYIRLHV